MKVFVRIRLGQLVFLALNLVRISKKKLKMGKNVIWLDIALISNSFQTANDAYGKEKKTRQLKLFQTIDDPYDNRKNRQLKWSF